MYYQTNHAHPSVWELPFNGLYQTSDCFSGTRVVDPQATNMEQDAQPNIDCWQSVEWIVIHNRNTSLANWLTTLGFRQTEETGTLPQVWSKQ